MRANDSKSKVAAFCDGGEGELFIVIAKAEGRDHAAESLWSAEFVSEDSSFEPTLFNLYKDQLAPLRRFESSLVRILMGAPELDENGDPRLSCVEFLLLACGTSSDPRSPRAIPHAGASDCTSSGVWWCENQVPRAA